MKYTFTLALLVITTWVSAQVLTIPDANFRNTVLYADYLNQHYAKGANGDYITVDINHDGQIQTTEADMVYGLEMVLKNISSLAGIEGFHNLTTLAVDSNPITSLVVHDLPNLQSIYASQCGMTSCDFTGCTNLKYLSLNYNQFTTLDLSPYPSLVGIGCKNGVLTSLNVSGLVNLFSIGCQYNQLTSLNVTGLTHLNSIYCQYNAMTTLNLNGLNELQSVSCNNNQLSSVSLEGCTFLQTFNGDANNLTSIDFNQCTGLTGFSVRNNLGLESIFMKNGVVEAMDFRFDTNLKYICCDANEVSGVESYLSAYSFPYCHINTYCTFVPGGQYYTIQGSNKYDLTGNGCEASDILYPNFKVNFTDGTTPITLIADATGNYSIPTGTGTFTLTPVLENPTYFTVSPATAQVTFPQMASPRIQNFCFAGNGVHQDLEVILVPVGRARAGMDATYTIYYRNKGTQAMSGQVKFTYADNVLDYVTANPVFSSYAANQLLWDFTNLQPFETRAITVVMNLNSPLETPPLNVGSQLNYKAEVTPFTNDEFVFDNTSSIKQRVVNSYDPNDKACTEGEIVGPQMIGQYVHYIIRFENSGTANALNIVVKDIIDTNRFDVTSLIPLPGSHPYRTILNGNKVEFIFENINLPFDDATNDGYLVFKIKLKSNLFVNSTFTNSASIYFDYNAPIVTNTYSTQIQTLDAASFDSPTALVVSPNPVKDILSFSSADTVLKVLVYDSLGRISCSVPVLNNKVDVSALSSGVYILQVYTDKGVSQAKIVKE